MRENDAESLDENDIEAELAQQVRRQIELAGVDSLPVTNLTEADMADIGWAGGPSHPFSVQRAIDRVLSGEVDYLAVRAPNGKPVSIGGIDYKYHEGGGYMWQLATMESLRGLGLGTRLITEMEERIRQRGITTAMLGVEDDNPAARRLYERLGYEEIGPLEDSWEETDAAGNKHIHHAVGSLLSKGLSSPS